MIEVDIHGLTSDGDGVGRLESGQVVFVPGALPGDRVRVRLTTARKGIQLAELVELLDPSALRERGRCTIDACGGCALKNAAYAGQAELKRQRVLDNLSRLGHLDVSTKLGPTLTLGDGWRYRHRVRLHAAHVGGRWQLGYYAARSHTVVPVSGCPVLWRELEQAALALGHELASFPAEMRLKSVELAHSRRDGRTAAALHGLGAVDHFRRSLSWIENAGLSGVRVLGGAAQWSHGNVELRYDHARAADFDLRFEPTLFTQAFPEMNDRLVEAVMRAVQPKPELRIVELHAGVGNFTLPLASAGASVFAVERQRRAAIMARRNLRTAGLSARVVELADTEALAQLDDCDVLVLDPPRTGARDVCRGVAGSRAVQRLVYVSCDSATLARDVAGLVHGGGFEVVAVEAFDMFPQTPHVEVVMTLERPHRMP